MQECAGAALTLGRDTGQPPWLARFETRHSGGILAGIRRLRLSSRGRSLIPAPVLFDPPQRGTFQG